jgi:hypothetical protein
MSDRAPLLHPRAQGPALDGVAAHDLAEDALQAALITVGRQLRSWRHPTLDRVEAWVRRLGNDSDAWYAYHLSATGRSRRDLGLSWTSETSSSGQSGAIMTPSRRLPARPSRGWTRRPG